MKTICIICLLLLVGNRILAQEITEQSERHSWWYPSLNLLTAVPSTEFSEAIEKNTIWGFNFDTAFRPFKHATFFQPGTQFEFLFPVVKNETWKGARINTTGAIIKANLFTRFKFYEGAMVSPFIETAFGLNLGATSTTTKIVDEATFLEQFFLNAEDEIETVTLVEHYDTNYNTMLGVGCVIKQLISIQVKYNFGPSLEYIKKDNIIVSSRRISYKPVKAPYQTVEIALGFSFESSLNK
ncbi:hypothetical protein [Carboxylicivirga caseinilyticus]|uniref:hypothetical protein n=1 Tax=Carboxylicivirga caseinilyticus TaxID=3417572 RepID=UPI003D337A82|nr:hypothetical protein [Marinilabiliaceae bacterium A049]